MSYSVTLAESAQLDLLDIHLYVELNDSPQHADDILVALEDIISRLGDMPERGHFPPELERAGIREYREVHCKPYRIIYSVRAAEVIVHCILDGRRDMKTLLERRLLR